LGALKLAPFFRGINPHSPHQRLCPWTLLGALPPDPRYKLALRARHGPPLWQIPDPSLLLLTFYKFGRKSSANVYIPYQKLTKEVGRVATNLENLEYSGTSLNMENSGNSVQPQGNL